MGLIWVGNSVPAVIAAYCTARATFHSGPWQRWQSIMIGAAILMPAIAVGILMLFAAWRP